jgi:hypothetical protein
MADRTSAELFSEFFCYLASDLTAQHLQWAQKLWVRSEIYDFSPYQMFCDEALLELGLASKDETGEVHSEALDEDPTDPGPAKTP